MSTTWWSAEDILKDEDQLLCRLRRENLPDYPQCPFPYTSRDCDVTIFEELHPHPLILNLFFTILFSVLCTFYGFLFWKRKQLHQLYFAMMFLFLATSHLDTLGLSGQVNPFQLLVIHTMALLTVLPAGLMWFKIETTKDDMHNMRYRKIGARSSMLLLLFQTLAFLHFLLTSTESNLETQRIYIMVRTLLIFISLAI